MKTKLLPNPKAGGSFLALALFSTGLAWLGPEPVRAQGNPAQTNPGQGQAAVPAVKVDSIAVTGNSRLAAATIIGTLGFQAGVDVTYREIQTGIKNLYSTGQFADVIVRAEGNVGEPVTLILEVEEVDLVSRITFSGLEHASEGTVRDSTGLQANQPYSPPKVLRAKDFIRAELAKKGIPFARIEERTEEIEGQPGLIHLFLDVTEGNRITVAMVEVQGNDAIMKDDILEAMQTKKEGFFWFRGGSYDAEVFGQDLEEAIPSLYQAQGFLDFRVVSDSLVVDPQTGKTRIELQVDEGPQYRLDEFVVEGNRHFSTEEIERYFAREEGGLLSSLGFRGSRARDDTYFDARKFEEAVFEVQQAYNNDGYLYARVEPWIVKLDAAEGEGPSVRAGWRITEANPAYINRIRISGNEYTHERVIRERIYVLPGDVYSQERLLQSYQSIGALGFFETPLPMPDIQPDEQTGDVDITFYVEERQTGSINFGTAVGGGTGVSGFLGYDQPNLFGQAKQGHLRWDFGRYINSFTLSFTDPALFESRVSGTLSLFNSRDRFFQFATGKRKRQGFSTRFGFPVPWSLRTQIIFGYSLALTEYTLFNDVDDTSLFGLPPGTQSQFSVGITRNNLSHPIFPVAGSRQSWNTEFNGGILGGDGDFIRHLAEGSWFVPVGQVGGSEGGGGSPIRFTLGIHLKGGAVFGDVTNFPFDRFWMGGVQFGENLRGYDETSITPTGYYPERSREISDISRLGDAFLATTAELAMRISDNLSISTFFDAGNVWADARSIDPTRLFRGAGLGVQLVTPFGPIGLDYAYGFDKPDPGWQLHFRMGPGY
ncbi:MAG: outer membrane protein assembly factor BamA [Gemmatimonadota bacterium]